MPTAQLSNEERDILVSKVQRFFIEELGDSIGQFDAEFLIGFFNKELGPYHYNQGLRDAQVLVSETLEQVQQRFYEMEKLT